MRRRIAASGQALSGWPAAIIPASCGWEKKRGQRTFSIICIVLKKRLAVGRRFPWAAKWTQTRLQSKAAGRLADPYRIPKRPTTTQTLPQLLDLRFGLRFVDVLEPALGSGHGAGIEHGPRACFHVWHGCGTGPQPILSALDKVSPDGITLHVAEHGEQMIVFRDGKAFESSLPDVAGRMVVVVIAAHMCGEQPRHVSAEIAVLAWPKRQMEMVRHQAKAQQAHGHMLLGVAQQLDEGMEIALLMKNGAAAIAAVENVVTVAAQCNS